MKFIKTMMVFSIFIAVIAIGGCKKEKYLSRDTSGLKPPPPVDTTKPPVVDTSVVIDNADKLDGWSSAGDASVATTGQKEGTGYIKNSIKAGSDFMQFIKTLLERHCRHCANVMDCLLIHPKNLHSILEVF